MTTADDVLRFWIEEIGPEGWYKGSAEIDRACTDRFGAAHEQARNGAFRGWLARPEGALAYLILTDQMPRNIHRGTAAAFSTDALALSGTVLALNRGHDLATEGEARQFFYLPMMHTESCQIQTLAVCLFRTRMPGDNLLHARAHRDIIRRFGRFPFRNAALGRVSSAAEQAFLKDEGYGGVVAHLKG